MRLQPLEMLAARRTLGLTQFEMADALGLEGEHRDRTISRWETGAAPMPGPASLAVRMLLDIKQRKMGTLPAVEYRRPSRTRTRKMQEALVRIGTALEGRTGPLAAEIRVIVRAALAPDVGGKTPAPR